MAAAERDVTLYTLHTVSGNAAHNMKTEDVQANMSYIKDLLFDHLWIVHTLLDIFIKYGYK